MQQRTIFRSFLRDTRGNMMLSFGLSATMLFSLSIGVVEISNNYRIKRETQSALDAAVLSATQVAGKGDVQTVGEEQFLTAMALREIDAENIQATFTYDPLRNMVDGTTTYQISTISGDLLGLGDTTISADASAAPKIVRRVEIALALDTSGSMDYYMDSDVEAPVGERRVDVMRNSISQVLASTMGSDQNEGNIYLSIIPFASGINITDQYNTLAGSNFDGAPSLASSLAALQAGYLNGGTYEEGDQSRVYAEERHVWKGLFSLTLSLDSPEVRPIPVYGVLDRAYNWYGYASLPHSSWVTPDEKPLPLTNSRTDVDNFLATFAPYGGTAGHLGMIWALYSLTPSWENFWGLSEPISPFGEENEKVIIMITDGKFSTVQRQAYSPYWYPWNPAQWLIDINTWWAYKYFEEACEMARGNNVTIFTIALAMGGEAGADGMYPDGTPLGELQRCPGDPSKFYLANDAAGMDAAMAQIVAHLGKLRLTQ